MGVAVLQDMAITDEQLPETTFDFLQLALWCIAIMVIVCALDVYILLAVSPCLLAIVWLRRYNLKASVEIKRVEGKHRSPIYAHLSQTLDGIFVLHSFPGATQQYLNQFEHFMSEHTRAFYNYVLVGRWFGSRLDMLVWLVTVVVLFVSVGNKNSASDTGLTLGYLMQLTGIFQWMIRQSAEVENQLTSCERVVEYTNLPAEEETDGIGGASNIDPPLWPTGMDGSIEVSDLRLWYVTVLTLLRACQRVGWMAHA
jgi:ATP-binding cassette, subfamily C (CFTR/MRP), member 4